MWRLHLFKREASPLDESTDKRLGPKKSEVVLVIGGTRSGKSDWARRYVDERYNRPVFLATAEAGDAEVEARIARHWRERGPGWGLIEEPREIARALIGGAGGLEADVALVDCLTMWITNVLLAEGGTAVERRIEELCTVLCHPPCSLGSGLQRGWDGDYAGIRAGPAVSRPGRSVEPAGGGPE